MPSRHGGENASYTSFRCDCKISNEEILTCEVSEEWILAQVFDNRHNDALKVFEYPSAHAVAFDEGIALPQASFRGVLIQNEGNPDAHDVHDAYEHMVNLDSCDRAENPQLGIGMYDIIRNRMS